jgi:hypothetical protein
MDADESSGGADHQGCCEKPATGANAADPICASGFEAKARFRVGSESGTRKRSLTFVEQAEFSISALIGTEQDLPCPRPPSQQCGGIFLAQYGSGGFPEQ